MRRLSISNLAWPDAPVETVAPRLKASGLDGVELAPTVIWPDAPHVPAKVVREYADRWRDHGLAVSGIQSLLYGRPELQLFDRRTWPGLTSHLTQMLTLAREVDTHIAVFGSPRNRTRGERSPDDADRMALEFFHGLIPELDAHGVILTLEPNAPAYGADYLTRYSDAVALSEALASPWVQPQIDTGCMAMVGESPTDAIRTRLPAHLHVSAPDLLPPPGPVDHETLQRVLNENRYDGWIVLEMLQAAPDPLDTAIASAQWLSRTYVPTGPDHAAR